MKSMKKSGCLYIAIFCLAFFLLPKIELIAAFAADSSILVPDGLKRINRLKKGDKVVVPDISKEVWTLKEREVSVVIEFLKADSKKSMILLVIDLEEGEKQNLLVTTDQLFLMPDKKVKAAINIVAGEDRVLSATGKELKVLEVKIGEFKGAVYQLSLSGDYKGKPDDHLVVVNGVVAADFCLNTKAGQLREPVKPSVKETMTK
ncbi:MAG: hypothetical protein Kow0029_03640 [Candidatus Rifleibacteriota bacterium]